jgi:GTPase Era involved in 16S rRNA processing
MSKFSKVLKEAKAKNKYISKNERDNIKVLKNAIKESTVVVTCMGLYNHGKSTLLNTLVKDFEHKTFKTADVRETAENKKVIYEDITFVDTPGLNAKENDNKRVMDAVKESDINLFVHNVSTGEFTKVEVEFLQNIKKHWKNPKEFIERTIFVLSRTDTVSQEDINSTKKRMQQQVKDLFEIEAIFVGVSAKTYTKGMLENKKLLVKKSNIDTLQSILTELKDSFKESILKTKKERLQGVYDELIKKLSSKIQTNKLQISQINREIEKFESDFKNDISLIQDTLLNYYSRM